MRSPLIAVLAIATLLTGGTAECWAQSRIVGPSVERFSEGEGNFVTFGLRRTDLARSGNGVDVAVGLVPRALAARVLLLQVDAGFAQALPVGPATVLLKGGMGNFLALGAQTELYPGVQAGLAVVLPLQRRLRLRVDLTRHYYFPQDGRLGLWSLSVGLAELPARLPS
jgi:hypothetical protein